MDNQRNFLVGCQWFTSCNPSYLGGCDQEDHNLRPAQFCGYFGDPISQITREWTGSVTQIEEPCKHEALGSNPSLSKKGTFKFLVQFLFLFLSFFLFWTQPHCIAKNGLELIMWLRLASNS
jgi:hypothetical protein